MRLAPGRIPTDSEMLAIQLTHLAEAAATHWRVNVTFPRYVDAASSHQRRCFDLDERPEEGRGVHGRSEADAAFASMISCQYSLQFGQPIAI